MEEKTAWLIICFAVSFLTAAGFSVCALWRYHRQIRGSVLAPLQLGTLGIFLAVTFLFIPYYFKQYSFGDGCTVIRPILLPLHNSLRVFILDGDFDCIPKVIAGEKTWLQVSYSLYAALLYILAPFLTFSNLLPLFKNMKGELRYRFAGKSKRNTLTNHAEIPYHIHFIGKMSDQFDYSNIYNPDLEMAARAHHKDWSEIRREILQERPELEEETAATESTEGTQPLEKKRIQEEEYEKHEYYRTSSIAKELYLREIAGNSVLSKLTEHDRCLKTCTCENCMRRKRSEHMRWNAYTRIIGYSYSKDGKNDRAKLHGNLCAWDDLSELEKQMD